MGRKLRAGRTLDTSELGSSIREFKYFGKTTCDKQIKGQIQNLRQKKSAENGKTKLEACHTCTERTGYSALHQLNFKGMMEGEGVKKNKENSGR